MGNTRLSKLIEAAEAKIDRYHTYVTAEDGRFQVYLTPVEQRTRAMKPHYRVGYYLNFGSGWKRVNRARFISEMESELVA